MGTLGRSCRASRLAGRRRDGHDFGRGDLREASQGWRVSLVMAKQKLADFDGDRDMTAAIALLEAALNRDDWT